MFTHQQLWDALDRVAELNQLSPSALAKKAGLDATSFNKSKRLTPEGRLRWPSTETLAKVLAAVNMDFASFAILVDEHSSPKRRRKASNEPLRDAAE